MCAPPLAYSFSRQVYGSGHPHCPGVPMRVERLRFTDFRNYRELDLALPGGLAVLQGRNAQGKSNILEAIGLIATSRSFRTSSEREAVRWGAQGRFARI